MFSSLLITFRETLEAVLVIGIVITFLTKTNLSHFKKYVFNGAVIGILAAVIFGFLLEVFFGGFEGKAEQIFEGILMFVTVGFLTWMIMWVHKQKDVAKKLKQQVASHAEKGYGIGISILIASSVFREGVETVLYLKASSLAGSSNLLLGGVVGILSAVVLGFILFRYALKINLNLIFKITNVFLVLFAAGILSHGVHEFQEAGLIPIFSFDPVFNISHILDHKSDIGSILRVIFGYTSKPTVMELSSYGSYFIFILMLQKIVDRKLRINFGKII